MKSSVRAVSCLLTALLASASLLACGDAGTETETTAPASDTASKAVTEPEDPRLAVKEEIPDGVDYGGYKFRIQSRDADHHAKELTADTENGETINDAVYRRNTLVEDRLNIELVPIYEDEADEFNPIRILQKAVSAGEDYCDLALGHTIFLGTLAADGILRSWYDIPVIDFSKPWWHRSVIDELTIGGKLYLANGDLCISAIDYTWAMLYNKQIAVNHDLGDIYQLVNDGKWTIDRMQSMMTDVAADLDGSGTMDEKDRYGFVTHNNSAIVNWMFALGQKVTQMNDEGYPELILNNEHMVSLVEKVYDLIYTGSQTLLVTDPLCKQHNLSHDLMVANTFANDQALFAALRIYVIDALRSMNADFGIIPFPKYDEAQEGYYTHVDGHAPLMGIPQTVNDLERTGVIMEVLNAESYRTAVPAVYNVVLTEKYARDEMSVHMLDLILNGRTQNFGYVYESGGMQWSLTNLINSKSKNFASYYKKNEKKALEGYQKIIDAHLNIDT